MGIEIRPNAVRSQLAERGRRLDAIASAVQSAHDRVDRFCGTGGTLAGSGYEAARVHMGQYKSYCIKVATCVEMARDADSRVKGALGRFGGMSVVSGREWLEKKSSAQRQASRYRSEASRLAAQPLSPESAFGAMCARFSASRWDRQAEYASKKLSDIYSYCAETNGLYEGDLGKLTDAVRAGASAFASCRFDSSANRWEPIDYSWTNDEIEAIAANNMGKLLFKGCGDVDRALMVDPVAAPVAKWWEDTSTAAANWWSENGTTAKNVGKVVFGVVGITAGILMIGTGFGAPAGMAALAYVGGGIGAAYGMADVATGIAGLGNKAEYDWEKGLAAGVANATGADEKAVVAGVEGVGAAVNLVNIGKLPANAGKLINSSRDLYELSKSAKVVDSVAGGFGSSAAAGISNAAKSGSQALRKEVAGDALELAENLKDPFNLGTTGMDKLTEAKRGDES